ncbi:MAG: hypothetical protein COV07_04465 [Candidatus Vogelbacteria bacterium CG10_big_fil_rev_8_21_14_0_10_45_14]|uniref:Bacterial type II secretion system protein E domain-containing protein n=1 Tax=Candidatus Vogelbacteria bacterium CG10_big_fil_rev_8_21_14_0_10_45_14 TaxID=1975042 RepID=A0A2H0RII6_9BACT|nr:MAG: hypothetical protein COV07_04465 [Candidatus Vogelbacteria bacterium CG10_big_fil_rev_8_21_14_0_10_45_14]
MALLNPEQEEKQLEDLKKEEAEELSKLLAVKYGLPYLDLTTVAINTDALRQIDEPMARSAKVAAFRISGRNLSLAVFAPKSDTLPAIVEGLARKNYKVEMFMVSEESLARAWALYSEVSRAVSTEAGQIDIVSSDLELLTESLRDIASVKKTIEDTITSAAGHGTSRVLEVVMAGAIAIGASDVHFEPAKDGTMLRLRIDGVLIEVATLTEQSYRLIVSRIKLISALKLNIKDTPQDGRFSIEIGKREIEVRTSILPGPYGETIVMRLLDPATIRGSLSDLGASSALQKRFEDEIGKPNGLVLVTGPTGSGKTTTLYAFLGKVNVPGVKIITIEDPIEYHMKGVTQTNVQDEKGYTFLEGLRSALRQDPDVIMVGEIRDNETANTATQSALTGHLVFSTLHTNNAAGAIPRLIDLGVNPKIISSALNISIAQRLVRKLCEKCKQPRPRSEREKKLIESVIENLDIPGVEIPEKRDVIFDADSCAECNFTGYKGRIAILEAIFMDKAIEDLISMNPSEREIAQVARSQGIPTMIEDGVLKLLAGITTLVELERVVSVVPFPKLEAPESAVAQ